MALKKNKFASWPELIGKTELTDVVVDEVSFAQPPANQHSRVVMMKSLAFNFTPLGFAKAGQADPSWPDESPIDDATDPGMNFTDRVARKRKKAMKKMVKRMVRKAVDTSDGQSGGRSFSESDRPGTSQDARSPDEHADDTFEILRTMDANPPTDAERWADYAARVFGDAVGDFTSDELNAAKRAFAEIRNNVRLTKSLGDGLNELAYQKRLASGNTLSFAKAFTAVCKERPDLYLASRGIVKAGYPRADSTMNVAGDDADSMSPEEANAYILQCANQLQQQCPNWSRTMCLLTAGSQHPGIYARSRQS